MFDTLKCNFATYRCYPLFVIGSFITKYLVYSLLTDQIQIMVIKTGRRISSLDLGNESSDTDVLAVTSSNTSNTNNRSILGQPSYVIPVDYSCGHSQAPNHHLQGGGGTDSQNSHG